jgi:glycosyltransferase involved in cell wall biosynthesis
MVSASSAGRQAPAARPPVSVVVPFSGTAEAAAATVARLAELRLGPGDELIVADNSHDGCFAAAAGAAPGLRVVPAAAERSSYYARNAGAEAATNEWLLFFDADCRPAADLIDAYFSEPVPADCAIVAGAIEAEPGQERTIARYARDRGHVSERFHVTTTERRPRLAGVTGNELVRASAFASIGGFHEGVRSGADVELSWRVQDAGWGIVHRPAARVFHSHVETLGRMASQAVRHAAGRLWVNRRYPGSFPRPTLVRPLARCAAGVVAWTLTGRFRRGLYKLIDAAWFCANWWGWHLGSNAVDPAEPLPGAADSRIVVVTDAFPARSETFVYNEALALAEAGWKLRVESSSRPLRTERRVARRLPIAYLEDDPPRTKLATCAWLCARHPVRVIGDLRDRRRWRREEDAWPLAALAPAARRLVRSGACHVHAHFAAGAALHAMRLARLTGLEYSVTAHAYELFQRPANLTEKLERAVFVAGECEHTVEHMRSRVDGAHRARIHRIATGVDAERFRRRRPHPGGGRVVAIGRLVEKKGFANLVAATERLRDAPGFERLVIAGDGPLHADLEREVERRGLGDVIELRGNVWGATGVIDLLETADVLAIPSVIAADGDRDALPLVSYEALAMEVPVVASDLVGLPEVVRPEWGALVPPGDPAALAEAIASLLAKPPAARAAMGAAGRTFVSERFDSTAEAARLGELISSATGCGPV